MCSSQIFFQEDNLVHEDAERVAVEESIWPDHLKNPHYQNPRIRAVLARSSWFAPGENRVTDRETSKIDRNNIFNVLNHAGLLPQQNF